MAKKHGRKYGDLSPALPERGGSLPGERKNFIKNDNGFVCAVRQNRPAARFKLARPLPFCLYSLHVDIVPGDRASGCGGLLVPLAAETDARRGYMIIYRCKKCGAIKRNKSAHDAKISPTTLTL